MTTKGNSAMTARPMPSLLSARPGPEVEASQLAQRQYKFIQNLEAALVRIENKTYGVCRVTGKLIPKERLRLVPHATLTVEAKEKMSRK